MNLTNVYNSRFITEKFNIEDRYAYEIFFKKMNLIFSLFKMFLDLRDSRAERFVLFL